MSNLHNKSVNVDGTTFSYGEDKGVHFNIGSKHKGIIVIDDNHMISPCILTNGNIIYYFDIAKQVPDSSSNALKKVYSLCVTDTKSATHCIKLFSENTSLYGNVSFAGYYNGSIYYYVNDGVSPRKGSLKSYNVDSDTTTTISLSSNNNIEDICQIESKLYITVSNNATRGNYFEIYDLENETLTVISECMDRYVTVPLANNMIYYLEHIDDYKYQVKRCNYDGSNITSVANNLYIENNITDFTPKYLIYDDWYGLHQLNFSDNSIKDVEGNLYIPGEMTSDGRYLYVAKEMGGLRMGITRVDPKNGKKKVLFKGNRKYPLRNGYYDLQIKDGYIYFVWDSAYGTSDQDDDSYICRIKTDGTGFEVLFKGYNYIWNNSVMTYRTGETDDNGNEYIFSNNTTSLNSEDRLNLYSGYYNPILVGTLNGHILSYINKNDNMEIMSDYSPNNSKEPKWFSSNTFNGSVTNQYGQSIESVKIKNIGTLAFNNDGGIKLYPSSNRYKSKSLGNNSVLIAVYEDYMLVENRNYSKGKASLDIYNMNFKKITNVVTWRMGE